jgi:hypothetical protein
MSNQFLDEEINHSQRFIKSGWAVIHANLKINISSKIIPSELWSNLKACIHLELELQEDEEKFFQLKKKGKTNLLLREKIINYSWFYVLGMYEVLRVVNSRREILGFDKKTEYLFHSKFLAIEKVRVPLAKIEIARKGHKAFAPWFSFPATDGFSFGWRFGDGTYVSRIKISKISKEMLQLIAGEGFVVKKTKF